MSLYLSKSSKTTISVPELPSKYTSSFMSLSNTDSSLLSSFTFASAPLNVILEILNLFPL